MRLVSLALVFAAASAAAQAGIERVQFGEIVGTLHRPEQPGRHPAVVIVHGSAGVAEAREGF